MNTQPGQPDTGPSASGKSLRNVIAALAIGLLVVGLVGVLVLRTTGFGIGSWKSAGNRLEDWIGTQIIGIANSYLVPQIAFDNLDYQAPGTVVLQGVSLTAPDGTRVLEMDTMTVTLAQVPRVGEPIVIAQLSLNQPTVRLIRQQQDDGSMGFAGLQPIVKHTVSLGDSAPEQTEQSQPIEDNFQLSRVLRLKQIDIADGSFYYDPGQGQLPMTIAGLSTTVMTANDPANPGAYQLDIDSSLGSMARLVLKGTLNLDTLEIDVSQGQLRGQMEQDVAKMLPDPLQQVVLEHQLRGSIEVNAAGHVELNDPLGASATMDMTLRDGYITNNGYQLPIDSMQLQATMDNGRVTLTSGIINALEGTTSLHGDIDLTQSSQPVHVFWEMHDLSLGDLLVAAGGQTPQSTQEEQPDATLAGTLACSGSATTTLVSPRQSLAGQGELHIRNGKLLIVPGLSQLADLMHIATAALVKSRNNHTLDITFTLDSEGMEITKSELTTGVLGARATGRIGFDHSLDLAVNAGPLEKLQSMLGAVGDVIGSVTDRLVKYRIRGTIEQPEVSVDPLGLGG